MGLSIATTNCAGLFEHALVKICISSSFEAELGFFEKKLADLHLLVAV